MGGEDTNIEDLAWKFVDFFIISKAYYDLYHFPVQSVSYKELQVFRWALILNFIERITSSWHLLNLWIEKTSCLLVGIKIRRQLLLFIEKFSSLDFILLDVLFSFSDEFHLYLSLILNFILIISNFKFYFIKIIKFYLKYFWIFFNI